MPSDYARVEHAIRFLEDHAREQPELERVAQEVGLSPFHFQRLFQRWAGVSPKRFLQALTVAEARQLLEERSVLETSIAVGLSGPSRLHDLFLRVEAMTPGESKSGGAGMKLRFGVHATPFGDALFAATERGLAHLAFVDASAAAAVDDLRARWPGARLVRDPSATQPEADELARRARGAPKRELGLLLKGTPFQLQVWQGLLRVPAGQLATYGQIAGLAGVSGARAVGTAVGQNPIAVLIPCHRVIRATGALGGYRWGPARKRALVAFEQVRCA